MNILIFLFALELGVIPNSGFIEYPTMENIETSVLVYTSMDARVVFLEHIFVGGSVDTTMTPSKDNHTFDPFISNYMFEAGVIFSILELGYRHICGPHPIKAYMINNDPVNSFEGASDSFYIRVSNGEAH